MKSYLYTNAAKNWSPFKIRISREPIPKREEKIGKKIYKQFDMNM